MRPLLFLFLLSLSLGAADPASFALPAPSAEATLPGEGALPSLGPAPGTYVLAKA